MPTAVESAAIARLANFAWRYKHLLQDEAMRTRIPASPPVFESGGVQLSLSEYQDLLDILDSGQGAFIFELLPMQKKDIALRIYEQPVNDLQPKLVFTLVGAALPQEVRSPYGDLVDTAYERFIPIACKEDNVALLRQYRLQIPHSIYWYE